MARQHLSQGVRLPIKLAVSEFPAGPGHGHGARVTCGRSDDKLVEAHIRLSFAMT